MRILSTPWEISINAMEMDIMTPERTGENKSRNPKTAPNMPNARSHPHTGEPSDLRDIEPTIRIMLEDKTHTAKINGINATSAFVPLPNIVQIPNSVDRIPLASIQPDRFPFSSLQKDIISDMPDINMEMPIKMASVIRFSSGVNNIVIPSIKISIPDISSNHFIDLNIFFIVTALLNFIVLLFSITDSRFRI